MRQDEHGSSYDYDNDASKTVTHKSSIKSSHHISAAKNNGKFDIVVIDGTWSQARKIYSRYIPLEKDGGPQIVCLSQVSLDILGAHGDVHCVPNGEQKLSSGRQLRRHPIKWREISTLEATRLLL